MEQAEQAAIAAAEVARDAIDKAIEAFKAAGFGSHVTQPLVGAYRNVVHALKEVQS